MSTTQKLAQNTLVQIIGKVIATIFGLAALLMMTRYLGAEQFGWYTTVISYLGFAGIIIDFGMIPVTASMLNETKFNKEHLFQNLLGFRFVSALLFFLIIPTIPLFVPFFGNYPQEVKTAILFTSISFFAITMNQIFVGYHQTKLQMHIQAIGEVIGRLFLMVGVFLLILGNATFLPFMWVVAGASIVYTLISYGVTRTQTNVRFRFDAPIMKAIFTKMWPIAIAILCNVIYLKGDILLLAKFHTQTDVGIYGAAYRVLDILTQLAMMIVGIFLPLLAFHWTRNNKDFFKKYLQQAFDALMIFILPAIVGIIVIADDIVAFFGNEEFIASATPLRILAIGLFGIYLGAVFGHTAVAINKQRATLWIYASNAIITLIGYLIFIPPFGMKGAAWMTVFSELYAGILLFLAIWYYSKTRLNFITFLKAIIATAVMGITLTFCTSLNIVALIIIGTGVYGGVLYAIGGINKTTIKQMLSIKKQQ
ncbi:MAG: flippase [Candidatus Magasanikbacteria bacterium]|jgi:O-antigen/teichoic acid export membrane protein|nr:flippase [Candidatus Magasanikbacteria bacterium]MBT4221003.1 flippase [Candidatus Magasanikbacteria bacterium]MBT4350521.1 flippase [Candidatus Magasanikbacteria bacterium]MBT4541926.1 flippase [Candidatus Magasanikbacteria bacterium]MBT6253057.1 flippase [Candidatus Magasanikbacteria bacterium]